MKPERRTGPVEVRASGRRLAGVVMVYGQTSPSHRERFEPGSLRLSDSVHLDLHHDPLRAVAWLPGGGLELAEEDGEMRMIAELAPIPAGDLALDEVQRGETTGLSVEFIAREERDEGGIRVIRQAELVGVGLVRSPSYLASRVEARWQRRRRIWL